MKGCLKLQHMKKDMGKGRKREKERGSRLCRWVLSVLGAGRTGATGSRSPGLRCRCFGGRWMLRLFLMCSWIRPV